ncbi:MAG TPA: glycosyltransferase family 2 protein [Planctomycetota bacterium]|jgi:glycosyltransferase involved in cell wall biosynthesis|nr:glycosyltransferase family 2 protein [Planctomycetota bacterium]
MPRTPVSLCIVALEEEDRLGDCLASVPFAEERLVVDSHSRDRTREVAARAGARVIERDWPGHVAQKEFAVRAARNDWVLCLDADERLSPGLRGEVEAILERGPGDATGFSMPRRTNYLGRWVRHGGFSGDRKVRLFDRRRGRWSGSDPHDRVEVEGPVRRLRGAILHFPYRDLGEHLRTIESYTEIMAREMAKRGRRAGPLAPPLHGLARFLRFYLLRAGFLDGGTGLRLARLAARYGYLKYAKLRALSSPPAEAPPLPRG